MVDQSRKTAHSPAHAAEADGSIDISRDLKLPAVPQLCAFDLDYTLWDLWVDTHVSPPLKRRKDDVNKIYDRRGKAMSL